MSEPYPGYFAGEEPPDLGCELPPEGWWCSIEPGHEGPCAARPKPSYVIPFAEFEKAPWHHHEPEMPRYKAPKSDLVEQIARTASALVGRRREDSILLLFRPRPWWLPPFLHRVLLRQLTSVVIYDSRVPLHLGPVRMEPFGARIVGPDDPYLKSHPNAAYPPRQGGRG